jgi:hypothetical protein
MNWSGSGRDHPVRLKTLFEQMKDHLRGKAATASAAMMPSDPLKNDHMPIGGNKKAADRRYKRLGLACTEEIFERIERVESCAPRASLTRRVDGISTDNGNQSDARRGQQDVSFGFERSESYGVAGAT